MFFAKALGGFMVVIFGASYAFGFFDYDGVERAVEDMKASEAADNARADSQWGPKCDSLRDKVMGVDESGAPAGLASGSAIGSIAKLHAAERKLRAAGCDIDKAPGALSPFEPDKGRFKEVTNTMGGGPMPDGSEWGGDPNAFNKGGSDDWGE
ncbi:MAG: hypothetical protein WBA51_03425 [Erythrobacter sp.]